MPMKPLASPSDNLTRRNFIRATAHTAALTAIAGAGGASPDAPPPGATPAKDTLAVPCGAIGRVKISRLLLGGNLVSGYMHARDLKYVGPLFRAYVTEKKLLETLQRAEQHGINTLSMHNPPQAINVLKMHATFGKSFARMLKDLL